MTSLRCEWLKLVQEMIKYHGQQIPPSELEWHLSQCPGVADVAVVPAPWKEDTQVPRALVALAPGVEGSETLVQQLVKHVDDKVPDHKRLRGGVTFIQSIPRLVTGKLDRAALEKI